MKTLLKRYQAAIVAALALYFTQDVGAQTTIDTTTPFYLDQRLRDDIGTTIGSITPAIGNAYQIGNVYWFEQTPITAFQPDLKTLAEYNGIYFDRETLNTYVYRCPAVLGWGVWDKSECKEVANTGYSFEAATWRSGIDALLHLRWPWLNPLDFATANTARSVLSWVTYATNDRTIKWSINEKAGSITGPFFRTTMRMICGDNGSQIQCFSAGGIANKLIRNNPTWAAQSWNAEVTASFSGLFVF